MAFRNLWRNPVRSIIIGLVFFLAAFFLVLNIAGANGIADLMHDAARQFFTGDIVVANKDYEVSISKMPGGVSPMIAGDREVMKRLESFPGVTHISPRIICGGMVVHQDTTQFLNIYGIMQDREKDILNLSLYSGDFMKKSREALVTSTVLQNLNLKLGDEFIIYSNTIDGFFNGISVKVAGVYDDGNFKFLRQNIIFINYEDAQRLITADNAATEMVLQVKDKNKVDTQVKKLDQLLHNSGLKAVPWQIAGKEISDSQQGVVFSLGLIYVISVLVILIIVFNLIVLIIHERFRELGTMLAIGFNRLKLTWLLILEGLILGILFSFLGSLAGYGLLQVFKQGINIGAGMAEIFGGSILYLQIPFNTAALIGLSIGIFGGLAALIASYRIRNVKPIDALLHVN
jgi:ABC-type lipoprotein release transport system permease subunit